MAEYGIFIYIQEAESEPDVDWSAVLGSKPEHTHVSVRAFDKDLYHEITWWISRPLNIDEWTELDNAESEVLSRIVGDGNYSGTAGPIPFAEKEPDDKKGIKDYDYETEGYGGT